MKTINAPVVDMLLVSQLSRNQRKPLMNFAPRIGLSIVDYGRLRDIDTFYLDSQNYRDYYRDPYNKLPLPNVFKRHYGKCGSRFQDILSEKLIQPTSWVRETQPVIYPINYRNDLMLDEGIRLSGRYYSSPCIKYKH